MMEDVEDTDDPEDAPFQRVVDHWERVVEDVAATAEQYRAAGWTVVELHPGDVTVLAGEPGTTESESEPQDLGLDVVVPGEDFDRLRAHVAERTFDSYEVFRAVDSGIAFLLVVLEDAEGDVAVFVPAYYDLADLDDLRRVADEHGLYTHVRKLSGEEVVTFEHEDAEPFFPDDSDEEDRKSGTNAERAGESNGD